MEAKDAIQIISSRKLVAQPGSYELRCTSITPFEDRFIVNFNGMTPYHVSEAKRLMKEGNIQDAVNQNITASQRATDYIPAKGEFVKVQVDNITTKSGVTGLFVVGVSELKAKATSKVSFSLEDEEVETSTKVTAKLGATQGA